MMNRIATVLFVFSFLIPSLAWAQPIFTAGDLQKQVGEVYTTDTLTWVDMSDQEGANMLWDFSAEDGAGLSFQVEILEPEGQPGEELFPDADVVEKSLTDGFQIYNYYEQGFFGDDIWGSFAETPLGDATSIYSDPERVTGYPLIYGGVGLDIYSGEQEAVFGNSTLNGFYGYEVVGYGTLLLNSLTYEDVLLVKIGSQDVRTTVVFGQEVNSFINTETYQFLKAGYHIPLLTFESVTTLSDLIPPFTTNSGRMILDPLVGIEEIETLGALRISPNPFTDQGFNLSVSTQEAQQINISVFDVIGNQVKSEIPVFLSTGSNNVEVTLDSQVQSGVYFVNIASENTTQTIRVVKQ